MKNPYDSYLMRKDKPKVIGSYFGNPVYEGEESGVEFLQYYSKRTTQEAESAAIRQLEAIKSKAKLLDGAGHDSSAKDANINLALACVCAVFTLAVLCLM